MSYDAELRECLGAILGTEPPEPDWNDRRTGSVTAILTAPAAEAPLARVEAAEALAGHGLAATATARARARSARRAAATS